MPSRLAKDMADCLVSAAELREFLNEGNLEAAHARLDTLIYRLDEILTRSLSIVDTA